MRTAHRWDVSTCATARALETNPGKWPCTIGLADARTASGDRILMNTASSIRLAALVLMAAVTCPTFAAKRQHSEVSQPKPAEATLTALSDEQITSAERVVVGKARCDANESVQLSAVPEQRGYFKLEYRGKSYIMSPEVTQTGAVRLEDKKNGLVWLQIPAKSMLMNAKIGQRMADNCLAQAPL